MHDVCEVKHSSLSHFTLLSCLSAVSAGILVQMDTVGAICFQDGMLRHTVTPSRHFLKHWFKLLQNQTFCKLFFLQQHTSTKRWVFGYKNLLANTIHSFNEEDEHGCQFLEKYRHLKSRPLGCDTAVVGMTMKRNPRAKYLHCALIHCVDQC